MTPSALRRPATLILPVSLWTAAPRRLGAQAFTTIHTFDSVGYASGSGPSGTLVRGANGILYGTTTLGGAFSSSRTARAKAAAPSTP